MCCILCHVSVRMGCRMGSDQDRAYGCGLGSGGEAFRRFLVEMSGRTLFLPDMDRGDIIVPLCGVKDWAQAVLSCGCGLRQE